MEKGKKQAKIEHEKIASGTTQDPGGILYINLLPPHSGYATIRVGPRSPFIVCLIQPHQSIITERVNKWSQVPDVLLQIAKVPRKE